MNLRPFNALILTLVLVASGTTVALLPTGPTPASTPAASSTGHTAQDVEVKSFDGTVIHTTVFKPANATPGDPVPLLLHSHGWSGERWTDVSQAEAFLDAGFGVVSIDMRGHGDSEGVARVHDPEYEARDVMAVIDEVGSYSWVEKDEGSTSDPVLGALGGSYGGAYQLITALTEVHETGDTRFDALAPEITWFNLIQSLAPHDVPRSLWVDGLYSLAKATGTRVHEDIDEGYAYLMATGDVPDGTHGEPDLKTEFYEHSPAAFVANGTQLDVPTLILQGIGDTLFNLNQAVANYEQTLTPTARADSLLLGHLTGHTQIPSAAPPGMLPNDRGTPCITERFNGTTQLLVDWYRVHLQGAPTTQALEEAPIMLATEAGDCVELEALPATTDHTPALTPEGTVTLSGAGAPTYVPIDGVEGTIAGIPTFDAKVTTGSVDTRFFVSLAVGETPATATIVDSQWMPVHMDGPVTSAEVSQDLAGVAVTVDEGETLYLVLSPTLDQFAHHPSRTPGPVVVQDLHLGLPLVAQAS